MVVLICYQEQCLEEDFGHSNNSTGIIIERPYAKHCQEVALPATALVVICHFNEKIMKFYIALVFLGWILSILNTCASYSACDVITT